MVVHRIKLYYSTTGATALHDWIKDWESNHETGTDDGLPTFSERIPVEPVTPQDSTNEEYYSVSLSFEFSEDLQTIFEEPYAALQTNCSWSRIGYHECEHDETDPSPCSWEQELTHGIVPDHVPDIDIPTQKQ
jgi:hypothetical protein